MRLILVRHGQPNELDDPCPHDPDLSGLGQRQAQAVADVLARESITHIISSPLQRARATAQPLAQATGLKLDVVEGWAEADRNTTRYRSMQTLHAQSAGEWARFLQDPIRYLGADPDAFRTEVLDAMGRALALPGNSRVAVFTHGMVINTVLSHLLGLNSLVHFAPGYGSFTRLGARSSTQVGVVSVNELGHQEALA